MDRDLEVANQIFEKILRDVPYNSATSMYVIAGKEYPARFGINCIGQSLILREKLKEADFTESVILRDLVFGRHCPLLLKINGERYYVDPYLMGYCPINLEEILGSQRKEKEFEAFPSLNGTASRLFFSFSPDGKSFRVNKTWPGSDRVDRFGYNFESPLNREPTHQEYFQFSFSPLQTTLSIRVLNIDEKRTDHLIYPINRVKDVDKNQIYIKTNSGESISINSNSKFTLTLEKMTSFLQTTNEEIIKFLLNSVKLYYQHKPN